MNRIDRISAILIQLQSKKVVKGQDIADKFGISLRTVYRDVKTLEEAGVPVIGEPGTGYSIMDGYRLPPIMFTKEEATALMTAEKLIEKFTDKDTADVYNTALMKIKAVLRGDDKRHLETMSDHIEVLRNPYLPVQADGGLHMQAVLGSIARKEVISINYFANHSQQHTTRCIEPVGIYFLLGKWYVIAYCWLREDYRSFRVDRISKIQATSLAYKQKHAPLKSFIDDITGQKQALQTVIMVVDKQAKRYLGEQMYYNGYISERDLGERVEMTFLTCSLKGFAHWYMMLGGAADIVEPASLKTHIATLAKEILEKTEQ